MRNPTSKANAEATDFFSRTSTNFQGSYSSDPDFIERQKLWTSLIAKYAAGKKTALDLGCGPGILTLELLRQNLAVIALDGSEEMVVLCEKNTAGGPGQKTEYIHDYLPTLSKLKGQTFDLILCSSVLEYVDDLEGSLARITNLLSPGGIALISMPNSASIYRKVETLKFKLTGRPEYRAHVKNMLRLIDFTRLVERAGIKLRESYFYGTGNSVLSRMINPLPAGIRKNLFLGVFAKEN